MSTVLDRPHSPVATRVRVARPAPTPRPARPSGEPEEAVQRPAPPSVWLQLWRNPLGLLGAVVLTLMALTALFGPLLPLPDPQTQSLLNRLQPPGSVGSNGVLHLAGTDQLGRDVFSRLVSGARVSLGVALAVVLAAGISGSLIGMFAGYRGGLLDQLVMRFGDLQTAFPGLLLAILLLYVAGASVFNLILMLAFLSWVGFGRIARSQTLSLKQRLFVESAVGLGASEWRIVTRHILPHLLPTLMVTAVLDFAAMIIAEAGLSFLGLGVQPPAASWGLMLSQGQQFVASNAWWLVAFPGVAMFATTMAANLTSRWAQTLLAGSPTRR